MYRGGSWTGVVVIVGVAVVVVVGVVVVVVESGQFGDPPMCTLKSEVDRYQTVTYYVDP